MKLTLIPDEIWFARYQKPMLWVANHPDGRDLLQIPRDFPRIFRINKNSCTALADIQGNEIIKVSRFHPRRVYGKLINNRWKEFQELASFYYDSLPSFARLKFPVAPVYGLRFTESTFSPASGHVEPVDGRAGKNDNSSWSTTRDAATGEAANTGGTNDDAWVSAGDSGANYFVSRAIICSDTSAIADTDTVSAATQALKVNANGGNVDGQTMSLIIYTGSTSTIGTDAYNDFDGLTGAMTTISNSISITDMSAGDTETWTLTDLTQINKSGITKIGIACSSDINGNGGANTPTGGNAANFFMADHASEPAPVLTVTHAAAATTGKHLLLLGVG